MFSVFSGSQYFFSSWSAGYSASDSFFGCFVVEFFDFRVVFSQPVDENTHGNEQVVSFVGRNGAVFNGISNCLSNSALRWSEHLNGLF